MNTANLQLQGLLVALGELLKLSERKGVFQRTEILAAIAEAERVGEDGKYKQFGLSDSHLETIRFPARFLREALTSENSAFDVIARAVGKFHDTAEKDRE